jgi:NTP pyrophosphatase (non-canonical NTP hydrolase)
LAALDVVLPGFKAMHPMGARLAQECVRITGGDFRSLIFSTQYRVPTYNQWLLDEADMASAYRWHRRLLQVLQCGHPGRRWVLKSPAHQWCLGAVLREYPDAMLVQTHRDPLHVIASLASLIAALRSVASDEGSLHEVAEEFADLVLGGLDRSVQARTDGTVAADRVFDVHFGAFLADPLATVRRLYSWLGIDLTEDAERRMRTFLAENPRGKHGQHQYAFADTGLDAGALRARARPYQEYFDVPSEPLP